MTAETIARALGGRKTGRSWMARCPAHDDHVPSLSIAAVANGKVLVRCHAGCDQRDVINALRARGVWDMVHQQSIHFLGKPDRAPLETNSAMKRTEAALAIWRATQSSEGTLVATYLRSRGITIPIPSSIRFHGGLRHPSGSIWPTMVALVTNGIEGTPIAVHRTFLAHDGSGKAPVEPAKMMLGPCQGGAVRLDVSGKALMIGEGIETCLAVIQASGRPVWAALSTSGMRALNLPCCVNDLIVLADGDAPGESAAQDCAQRWKREGRRVRIARPPKGMDFNDMLLGRPPCIEMTAR